MASLRSLSISADEKPGLNLVLAGDVGTTSGIGALTESDQELPVALDTTSKKAGCSSPSRSPITMASDRTSRCTARVILLQALTACPASVCALWLIARLITST